MNITNKMKSLGNKTLNVKNIYNYFSDYYYTIIITKTATTEIK